MGDQKRLVVGSWESGEIASVDFCKAGRESMKRWIANSFMAFGENADIRVIEAPSDEVRKYFEDYIKKSENHYRQQVEA